jgi:hypothetical protein
VGGGRQGGRLPSRRRRPRASPSITRPGSSVRHARPSTIAGRTWGADCVQAAVRVRPARIAVRPSRENGGVWRAPRLIRPRHATDGTEAREPPLRLRALLSRSAIRLGGAGRGEREQGGKKADREDRGEHECLNGAPSQGRSEAPLLAAARWAGVIRQVSPSSRAMISGARSQAHQPGWPYAVTMSHPSRSILPQGTPLPPVLARG